MGDVANRWELDDGRVIYLVTPRELAALPDGTKLVCIDGTTVTKGAGGRQNEIDGDTRGGYLAYGTLDAAVGQRRENPI